MNVNNVQQFTAYKDALRYSSWSPPIESCFLNERVNPSHDDTELLQISIDQNIEQCFAIKE